MLTTITIVLTRTLQLLYHCGNNDVFFSDFHHLIIIHVIILILHTVAEVGFEQDLYIAMEGDGTVRVCLSILSPEQADITLILLAHTEEGTAMGTYVMNVNSEQFYMTVII